MKAAGKCEMVGRNTLSREGSHEGCNCSWCNGGCMVSGLGKEVEEIKSPVSGGDNLGERWFNLENTSEERCSLLHLKCELDASLMFDQGDG